MEKVKIGFVSSPDYTGNAKALYEQLVERNLENYEYIWIIEDKEEAKRLQRKGIKVIETESENFKEAFSQIQILFLTHNQLLEQKFPTQTYISLWHGYGPKRAGLLNGQKEHEIKFAREYSDKIDYYVVQSEIAALSFNYMFDLGVSKLVFFPQPRNKYLKEAKGRELINKVVQRTIPEEHKIILYAPTFRNGIGRQEGNLSTQNLLNLEPYEEEKLNQFLEEKGYTLLLQLHPVEQTELDKTKMGSNIQIVEGEKLQENQITINEILNGVDIMITDYSSIYIDYLLLDRPILFLDTDFSQFGKDRGILFDSKEFWFCGPVAHTLEEVENHLQTWEKDRNWYKKERDILNAIVNQNYNPDFDRIIDDFVLKLEPKQKIPKCIHYWDRAKITEKQRRNIEKWQQVLPDFTIKPWKNDGNLKQLASQYGLTTIEEKVLEMIILYEEGGIFLDTNIEVRKDITPLVLQTELFIKDIYGNLLLEVIGCSKHNPIMRDAIPGKYIDINQECVKTTYEYEDVFVRETEQWRIDKPDFKDTEKYFNNTYASLRSKIGRSVKYGFQIDDRKK